MQHTREVNLVLPLHRFAHPTAKAVRPYAKFAAKNLSARAAERPIGRSPIRRGTRIDLELAQVCLALDLNSRLAVTRIQHTFVEHNIRRLDQSEWNNSTPKEKENSEGRE